MKNEPANEKLYCCAEGCKVIIETIDALDYCPYCMGKLIEVQRPEEEYGILKDAMLAHPPDLSMFATGDGAKCPRRTGDIFEEEPHG